MAKFEFNKSAKKKAPKPITETKISKPRETYDPAKMTKQVEEDYQKEQPKKKHPGRPKSGRKSYQTVRLQKKTVLKILLKTVLEPVSLQPVPSVLLMRYRKGLQYQHL